MFKTLLAYGAVVSLATVGVVSGVALTAASDPTVQTQTFTHEDVVTYTVPTITETSPAPPPVTQTVTVTTVPPTTTTAPPTTTTTTPPTTTATPPSGTVAPGQSWQSAYNAAPAGSSVSVLPGNHGDQTLLGSKAVTFLGQSGATVRHFINRANNFTLDNVDIDGGGQKVTILEDEGDHNSYRNLEVRNVKDIQMVGNHGSNPLFEDVVFHDAVMTTAGENAGVHMECIWSNAPGSTFRRTRFYNCSVFDLFLTRVDYVNPPQGNVCCITLEDSIFEPTKRTNNSGVHFTVITVHDNADNIDRYTFKRNRFDLSVNLGLNPVLANSVFCGNTGPGADASWRNPCTS